MGRLFRPDSRYTSHMDTCGRKNYLETRFNHSDHGRFAIRLFSVESKGTIIMVFRLEYSWGYNLGDNLYYINPLHNSINLLHNSCNGYLRLLSWWQGVGWHNRWGTHVWHLSLSNNIYATHSIVFRFVFMIFWYENGIREASPLEKLSA